jgi:hypothetical protein
MKIKKTKKGYKKNGRLEYINGEFILNPANAKSKCKLRPLPEELELRIAQMIIDGISYNKILKEIKQEYNGPIDNYHLTGISLKYDLEKYTNSRKSSYCNLKPEEVRWLYDAMKNSNKRLKTILKERFPGLKDSDYEKYRVAYKKYRKMFEEEDNKDAFDREVEYAKIFKRDGRSHYCHKISLCHEHKCHRYKICPVAYDNLTEEELKAVYNSWKKSNKRQPLSL